MPADSRAGAWTLDPRLVSLLRCPICKGTLLRGTDEFRCTPCNKTYPIVLGLPDFRLYEDPLIPLQDDYVKGGKVQIQAETLSFADLVRYYWSLPTYPYTPPDLKERFIRQVLSQEDRFRDSFLPRIRGTKTFLEVGCGTAALVKVAGNRFDLAVGCDVAFRWLLIARKRLLEAGLPANLVCCCADFLPFAPESFESVASVSLLEHVKNAEGAVSECDRVMQKDGSLFIYTSNRFSIGPEPHVRVWGVGFLPRRWMAPYVKWVRNVPYEKKYLLSWFELRRFLRKAGQRRSDFSLPTITATDWSNLKGLEKLGAKFFDSLGRVPFLRPFLLFFSPVIQVVSRRS
ncbi:MAG: methyltransferase domain-containing protein [Terriglobia bacterium]